MANRQDKGIRSLTQEGKEGNDQGDEDQDGDEQESNSEHVHAESEEKLVADDISEAHNKEERKNNRKKQSNQDEGLDQTEVLGSVLVVAVISPEGVGRSNTVKMNNGGSALSVPVILSGLVGLCNKVGEKTVNR